MFLTTGPLLIQDVAAAVTDVTISILAVGAVVLIALIVCICDDATGKKPLQRRSSGAAHFFSCLSLRELNFASLNKTVVGLVSTTERWARRCRM